MKATEKTDGLEKKQNKTTLNKPPNQNTNQNTTKQTKNTTIRLFQDTEELNRKLLPWGFFQYFIADAAVHDLITFFIPENSSFWEEAFVYGCYIMIYFHIMIYFQTTLYYKSIRCHKLNSYL